MPGTPYTKNLDSHLFRSTIYPHFTDEETKRLIIFQRSLSRENVGAGIWSQIV